MKRTFASILFILMVSLLTAQSVTITPTERVEERNGKQYFVHIVEKGHTVYSIAKAYNVTLDEVYFENPGAKNGINVNQEIFIPTINKESEIREEIKQADFDFFYHVCTENENFADVADIYLQEENNIRQANPRAYPPFREGEYLKIPVEVPESVIRAEFPPEAKKVTRNTTIPKPHKKTNTVSFNPNIPVLTDYRHVVVLGETTVGIAEKYNVRVYDLKAVNPGLGDVVEKGERLRIPANAAFKTEENDSVKPNVNESKVDASQKESTEPKMPVMPEEQVKDEGFVIHTVKKKETIYRISRDYGVTIQDLYDANPGLTEKIKPGQQIKVQKKKISRNYIIFEPYRTLSLAKVAKLHGVSKSALKKINPGFGKYAYRDDEVKIPVGSKALLLFQDDLTESTKKDPVKEKNPNDDSNKPEPEVRNKCDRISVNENQIKIALMVPLFLEDIRDSLQVDQVLRGNAKGFQPFMFVNFVEGAIMAIDSIRKTGVNISLKVYDVDNVLTKTAKVLKNPELKDVDLIIGPFYNQSFHQVALFAGNFGIPIINPLSYRAEILEDYKTVIKAKPTEEAQIPLVAEIIKQYNPNSKVFLITRTSYSNAEKVINLENSIREVIVPSIKLSNIDIYNYGSQVAMRDFDEDEDKPMSDFGWQPGNVPPVYQMEGKTIDPAAIEEILEDSTTFDNSLVRINFLPEGFDAFMSQASALRENLVIIYGTDKAFVMNVMNNLNEFRDSLSISVVGLPYWERFNNLDMEQVSNLNTINFESSYIDYNSEEVQDFIYNFRQQYNTEPGKYGFVGYDLTMYFSKAMFLYGRSFTDCLAQFESPTLSMGMWYKKAFLDNMSFENIYWNIIQYNNLKKNKIQIFSPSDIQ